MLVAIKTGCRRVSAGENAYVRLLYEIQGVALLVRTGREGRGRYDWILCSLKYYMAYHVFCMYFVLKDTYSRFQERESYSTIRSYKVNNKILITATSSPNNSLFFYEFR